MDRQGENGRKIIGMKKLLSLLSILTAFVFVLTACTGEQTQDQVESGVVGENGEQLDVMVTMFVQYDFARQVGGEYVNVSRLVAPGIDVHSFDPTPPDIIAINEADLFIYAGDEMEPWVHRILDSLDADDLTILDVSTGAYFLPWYGSHDHDHHHGYEEDPHHRHDHDDEEEDLHHRHDHDDEEEDPHHGHDHDEEDPHHGHNHDDDEEDHHHDHSHAYDPHIWTSPVNAIVMVRNIQEYLIALMPEQAEYFAANGAALIAELDALDQEFRDLMESAERTTIYHAGRFAVHYLMHEYGIDFVAAAMETEPDPALVARIITEIETYDIPVIFYEELVNLDRHLAGMIATETGAQALMLHTIHNVSADEIAAGITYVQLQRQNIEALRIALN